MQAALWFWFHTAGGTVQALKIPAHLTIIKPIGPLDPFSDPVQTRKQGFCMNSHPIKLTDEGLFFRLADQEAADESILLGRFGKTHSICRRLMLHPDGVVHQVFQRFPFCTPHLNQLDCADILWSK